MFDVPPQEKARLTWSGEVDIESKPWNVGLIVGPSGCGKSSLLRHMFGAPADLAWSAPSVIDDFDKQYGIEAIAGVCQAVGFNTIPAWMRPFAVLSNGERFRVELARRLLELPDPVVVDEFTSVVDRQVAQIGANAVQKHIRKTGKQFVAASCHYDIVEWLQPDWVLEPATMSLTWRGLQRRPPVECVVSRVPHSAWSMFAPFHYLTADLHRGARCFGLFVGDRLAAFAGMLHRPHAKVHDIMGCSRLVTLPDFQGLGLAMALIDVMGSAYRGISKRLHTYPAHPSLIRAFDRSKHWTLRKRPGQFSPATGKTGAASFQGGGQGGRPCAVFQYVGPSMARAEAEALIAA
jgi:ABC-type lipoprotein export system ATPase subunit